jgi:hypothetical protein
MSKRKGAWRFSAVWTFPGHIVATTDPSHLKKELKQMEAGMKRLVMGVQKIPLYLRNIQLKYKLSDWELARTKPETPIHLPVQGYIQSDKQRVIDYDSLKSWFDANWSPVENQLRRDATYQAWVRDDPDYRHVQVDGTPAVARAGRRKKDEKVLHSALPYHFFESLHPLYLV